MTVLLKRPESCKTCTLFSPSGSLYCVSVTRNHIPLQSQSTVTHKVFFVSLNHGQVRDWLMFWSFTWTSFHTGFTLVVVLLRISKKGKTVIFSIHQPRYSIFRQFDHLTLMNKGEIIYAGAADKAITYFEDLGTDILMIIQKFKSKWAVIC